MHASIFLNRFVILVARAFLGGAIAVQQVIIISFTVFATSSFTALDEKEHMWRHHLVTKYVLTVRLHLKLDENRESPFNNGF